MSSEASSDNHVNPIGAAASFLAQAITQLEKRNAGTAAHYLSSAHELLCRARDKSSLSGTKFGKLQSAAHDVYVALGAAWRAESGFGHRDADTPLFSATDAIAQAADNLANVPFGDRSYEEMLGLSARALEVGIGFLNQIRSDRTQQISLLRTAQIRYDFSGQRGNSQRVAGKLATAIDASR